MRAFCLILAFTLAAGAQSSDDDFKVYTDHPRLLLTARRVRLLQRERERQSPRWQQFHALVAGNARMPEEAFALALFYVASGDEAAGRRAITVASKTDTDLRQTALVYDWCFNILTDKDKSTIAQRLKHAVNAPINDSASARTAAFAAIATNEPAAVRRVVNGWWKEKTAKELTAGTASIRHHDIYPLVELLHAIRDTYNIDLRDDAPAAFKDLPLERLLSYYPATYAAAENDFRIPYSPKGDVDLNLAALTRAAELSLVAYDANSQDLQFVQGWAMHESFTLRGPFGAPYEFLWANPYQPGLPYQKLPLAFHNVRTGELLARSSWEEDAAWLGVFHGTIQMFREGRVQPASLSNPVHLGDAAAVAGSGEIRFQVKPDGPLEWFIVGRKPSTVYDIEVDDEDLTEGRSDRAGILPLKFTRADGQTVWVHERRSPAHPPSSGAR